MRSKTRRRQRALNRSLRNSNPGQYEPGRRQAKRARRAAAGLNPKPIRNPGGARHSRKDGKPKQASRKDSLSGEYRRLPADHAMDSRTTSQAKHDRATTIAADLTVAHESQWVAEDVTISNWTQLWG